MTPPAGVHAIILAAGHSRRLGSPKALLDFGGRSALDLYQSRLREAGVSDVTVVCGTDARVGAEAARIGCAVVFNPSPDDGRTRSLQIALMTLVQTAQNAESAGRVPSAFLLAPVDCPLASVETLRLIVNAPQSASIVRPVCREGDALRGGHPVRLSMSLAPEILQLTPDQSLRNIIHKDDKRRLDLTVSDPEILCNLDTKEQVLLALERFRKSGGE